MMLADSSVWIDHLRQRETLFSELLVRRRLALHPMVLGELALGTLQNRAKLLVELSLLPRIAIASDAEVRVLIERKHLHGRGIGYVDAHLLAATMLTPGTQLWTRNRRLRSAAEESGVLAPYS